MPLIFVFVKYAIRSRSKSQQHVLWHLMTIPHLIVKVFECECVVLNRISLIETPQSGNSLASVWIPWKKWSAKLIFAAFRDNLTFWSLSFYRGTTFSMNKLENRPCCSPATAQGRPVKETPGTVSITKRYMSPAAVRLFSESSTVECAWLWA